MEDYKIMVLGTDPSKARGIEAKDWTRIGQGDGFRVVKHPTKKYYL
jgi:surface antigen